jgi:RNA polymerase sigma factor (sigma-70 family)
MDRQELVRQQGEALEQQIWDDTALQRLEASVPACLPALGLTVLEVLAEVSDEGLVRAIQRGFLVKEALEELLENRYKELLFRWCYHWSRKWRRTFQVQDAEDLWHDLWVKFLETRFKSYEPQGENGGNFRSWLWATAHNQRVQALRKKWQGFLPPGPPPPGPGPRAEQLLLDKELEERLEGELRKLPEPDQHIMRATLDGRTLPEIAGELSRSYMAVAMRLFRARRRLEQALGLPARRR